MMSVSTLLAIGVAGPAYAALQGVARELALDVCTVALPDAVASLERAGVEAVVVGAGVDDPLLLAQRIYRAAPELPVLVLVEDGGVDTFRDALRFTPYIGEVGYAPAAVRERAQAELRELVERARKRRHHARTLRALDERLAHGDERPAERRGAEILGVLLEQAPVGVVILDEGGAVRGRNPKAGEVLGISPRDLLGASFAALFPTPEAERCRALLRELDPGRASASALLERVTPRGLRYVDVTAAALGRKDDGGYLLVLQDATERVQNLRALEDAVRMRDEFLTIASHELYTPLTALRLNVDRLALRSRQVARDDEAAAWLTSAIESIRRQGSRLERLVEELLAVARAGGSRPPVELEEIDLAEVARSVVQRFHDEGSVARARCTLEVETAPVRGHWDAMLLDQIVTNLVSNGLKYAAGKPVTLLVGPRGDAAALVVSDRGIGIAPEHHDRIFEKFERAVSTRHYGGFGIGLFAVKRAVQQLGGSIRVASSEGQGATFEVLLPRRAPDARA